MNAALTLPSRSICHHGHQPGDGDVFDRIARAIEERGYAIETDALPPELINGMHAIIAQTPSDDLQRAGIGRQDDHHLNRFVRTDRIRWIESGADSRSDAYLTWMGNLRTALNRRLFLGLFDYEAHFARYEPGAYYKRHVDAFRGQSNRVLTTVLYLNPEWLTEEGGELVIYHPTGEGSSAAEQAISVMPRLGTLVVFLSEDFPHEVLPASRTRHSIAGWFRLNTSLGGNIDPPR